MGAYQYAGGLVGWNNGTISLSYALGTVTAGDYAAGLVADDAGTNASQIASISESFSKGAVTNSSSGFGNGGLVAEMNSYGLIKNSYSFSNVQTNPAVVTGGFIATNPIPAGDAGFTKNIVDTYEIGDVTYTGTATGCIGGFVGNNDGGTGTTSSIKDSFWNTTTNTIVTQGVGCGPTGGVQGKTSSQLQAVPTNWDTAIWAQNGSINGGYPYLIDNVPP